MKKNSIFLLLLSIIILPLYIHGLIFGIHASGDLPFFYPENLRNLTYPWSWVSSPGPNGLGFNNVGTLWLFLPLSIFGFSYQLFNIDFYYSFSFVLFGLLSISAISIFYLAKNFGVSYWGRLLAIIVYLANSYILLVIDGGQLIFGLGYAFLPLFILITIKAFEKIKLGLVVFSSILLAILIAIDMRVAILGLLFMFIYGLFYLKHIFKHKLFFISFLLIFISVSVLTHLYWIYPLLNIKNGVLPSINNLNVQDLSFIKIDDALLLHQSLWPKNIFGEVAPAAFSFTFLSLLVFSNLLFKQTKTSIFLNVVALISIFLVKGMNPPFGEINLLIDQKMIVFNFFRDPSKFFCLLALCFALLTGISFDFWRDYLIRFAKLKYLLIFLIGIFIFSITIPISQGYKLRLNGLLGNFTNQTNFKDVVDHGQFYRSLWINQKPQVAFSNDQHPALDVYSLSENPLITSLALDNYDRTSFVKNILGEQILQILSVKNIFLDNKALKLSDQERRSNLIDFLNQQSWLKKDVNSTYYQTNEINDRLIALKNIFLVNGDQEIYNSLISFPNFKLKDNGFIFIDQLQKSKLDDLPQISLITDKDTKDTVYDLLSNNPDNSLTFSNQGQWGKAQLSADSWNKLLDENYILKHNYFPLSFTVFFSTLPNESIEISVGNNEGKSLVAQVFANRRGGSIEFLSNNQKFIVETYKKDDQFEWVKIPIDLKDSLKIVNNGGFNAIGKIIVVPNKFDSKDLTDNTSVSPKIYLLNFKDNKTFNFAEGAIYDVRVLNNKEAKLIFKQNEKIVDTKTVDQSKTWKDLGNIDFKSVNAIEVESSASATSVIDQKYNQSMIQSDRKTRVVYKEVNKKEVVQDMNSFTLDKVSVIPNSVINIDITSTPEINLQVRAHLYSKSVNTLEKQVDFQLGKLSKLIIPKGFDGLQFELLWPQNEDINSLDIKASYEDTQDITLVFSPQSINIGEIFNNPAKSVSWNYVNPTKYEIDITNAPTFIVFSERYNPNWAISGQGFDNQSVETYSLLNGFFIPKNGHFIIEYTPQKLVDKFFDISIAGLLISCLVGIVLYRMNK